MVASLWRWIAVAALVAAGIVGTVVALGARNADSQFLLRQKNPLRLTSSEVESLVRRTAPSTAAPHRSNARRASCTPGSRTGLKNPWLCTLDYPGGVRAVYRLSFRGDGSYVGRDVDGTGVIRGCCLDLPGQ